MSDKVKCINCKHLMLPKDWDGFTLEPRCKHPSNILVDKCFSPINGDYEMTTYAWPPKNINKNGDCPNWEIKPLTFWQKLFNKE